MDKRILDIVADFSQWKGDAYRLTALVVEMQKEIDKEKLVDYPEAVELL